MLCKNIKTVKERNITVTGKIIKEVVKISVFTALASFLSYLANSKLIFEKLISAGIVSENIDIPLIQDYCLWLGIIISSLFLSLNLIITKVKFDHILEQRNQLIKMTKDIFSTSLGKHFSSDTSSYDIRIFIPKYSLLYKIADKIHFKAIHKKFIIKNIDLIANQGTTKNLQFEVFPKSEGLVGFCYKTKTMAFDDDLENTNDIKYNLTRNQISKTSNLKWSICCPICNEIDEVIAIIALDGKTKIKIDKDNKKSLVEELLVFSRMLYDSVPQLFKR